MYVRKQEKKKSPSSSLFNFNISFVIANKSIADKKFSKRAEAWFKHKAPA
jgi:hypothetical protein